ncbi:MAG: hypothetical protein ACRYHQ_08750 [Janthinobacterium lividum]
MAVPRNLHDMTNRQLRRHAHWSIAGALWFVFALVPSLPLLLLVPHGQAIIAGRLDEVAARLLAISAEVRRRRPPAA